MVFLGKPLLETVLACFGVFIFGVFFMFTSAHCKLADLTYYKDAVVSSVIKYTDSIYKEKRRRNHNPSPSVCGLFLNS